MGFLGGRVPIVWFSMYNAHEASCLSLLSDGVSGPPARLVSELSI